MVKNRPISIWLIIPNKQYFAIFKASRFFNLGGGQGNLQIFKLIEILSPTFKKNRI